MNRLSELSRRALRRLRFLLHGQRAHFVYHPRYEVVIPGVPMDPLRAQRIVAYLLDQGFVRTRHVATPIPATLENVSRVHSAEYLDHLDTPEAMKAVLGFTVPGDMWQGWIDVQRLMAGGTIQATRLALRTGCVAVNLGGGLHHAGPETGGGYCAINDLAIAIARLRHRGFAERIVVVDLDIHDGNGTRAAFRDDPTVHTFSIHNDDWDDSAAVEDTRIPLGPDVTDRVYLDALRSELPPVMERIHPGLVLYVAGADPAQSDRVGNWKVSEEGILTRDQTVSELARSAGRPVPLAVVLGGGYGDKAWRYSARYFAWLVDGSEPDPQEDVGSIVRRFRRIEREASNRDRGGGGGSDWALTENDITVGLGAESDTRVLGYYSKHGLELQLERLGILNQIRAEGFASPTLDIDLQSALGHTVRLYGGPDRAELLMELRSRRDRTSLPSMEVLYVEWLLLQNPRRQFSPDQSRLPGQERPGLGLLREIVALLVVMCEQVELDGIMFVPSHYYMAAVGRRHLRFVRAADEAVYDAMSEVVGDLDLAAASRAIDAGRVVDVESGQPVRWHAPPMILPVSKRLSNRVVHAGYAAAYAAARSRLHLELSDGV